MCTRNCSYYSPRRVSLRHVNAISCKEKKWHNITLHHNTTSNCITTHVVSPVTVLWVHRNTRFLQPSWKLNTTREFLPPWAFLRRIKQHRHSITIQRSRTPATAAFTAIIQFWRPSSSLLCPGMGPTGTEKHGENSKDLTNWKHDLWSHVRIIMRQEYC